METIMLLICQSDTVTLGTASFVAVGGRQMLAAAAIWTWSRCSPT